MALLRLISRAWLDAEVRDLGAISARSRRDLGAIGARSRQVAVPGLADAPALRALLATFERRVRSASAGLGGGIADLRPNGYIDRGVCQTPRLEVRL